MHRAVYWYVLRRASRIALSLDLGLDLDLISYGIAYRDL